MKEQARVLVVDDNTDLLNTLALIFKRSGFSVDTAEDGLSAVNKFKVQTFDVTLMDIVMPRMSGVEAFRRIRQAHPGARVILMTAYYEEKLIKVALDDGALSVVYKPIDIAQVMQMIREAVLSPQVLIVDDDAGFCKSMARMLEMKGCQVYAAHSGEVAIEIAKGTLCPIAFVDVKLPLMDGLETHLRLKEINPGMVVVMMTAYRDEVHDTVQKALAASAAACLYKPFDPAQVLGLVSRISGKPF